MLMMLLSLACVDYELNRRTVVDSYVQSSRAAGVDIVWVVDDSASMFEEQEQLASFTSHFTDYLTITPIDFRLGVVTTDMSAQEREPGSLVGGSWLTPENPNLAEDFATLLLLDEGSRDEYGFEAALAALDPNGINADVLHPDADLELVVFADEDDQSNIAASEWVNTLQSFRSNALVSVNAITGDPPEGCASIVGAADPGFKYQEAQELSGGLRESICSLHYDTLLERIALKVLGLQSTFALNSAPDLETMEVLVDGAAIHRRARHGWQYDAGENAIVFDGFAVPPPGAEIVFKYALWIGTDEALEESETSDSGVSE